MPKKSNTKRSDGYYMTSIYIGRDENGKRKYKTFYGKTQKEADKKSEEFRFRMRKGIVPELSSDTFSTLSEYFLASKKLETTESQHKLISTRIKIWNEYFGNAKVSSIRPVDVQNAVNDFSSCNPITNKAPAKKTVISYLQILRAVFNYAIDSGIIENNPAIRTKIPKTAKENKEREALTIEERNRICEFEHRGKPAMMLLMFSGLRRGEATALLWSDIDFVNNEISVTKSYDFKTKSLKAPKNGKSRKVMVPEILTNYLKTLPQKSVYVLTNTKNQMMTINSWDRLLESYLYDMNLQYGGIEFKKYSPKKAPFVINRFTLHCLRHTFCTIMYEAGVDLLTAQQQMGHSDVKTTLSIYTHLQNQKRNSNFSKINDYISESL